MAQLTTPTPPPPNDHYHCPRDCEHPQPFERTGRRYCGRCYFVNGVMTEMVLCTPVTCPEDVAT